MSLIDPERRESDSDDDFNWDEYLRETKSTAAAASSFQQSPTPPVNKFEEGMKLEASDPRFPNIICAATVISKFGPKIRLRMIGAGANDDIWTLVDSRQIHPIGYTESQGGFLSPPFNCQRDGLRWANVLKNALTSTNANLAPKECFVSEPPRPKTNTFQVGQKLEACDFLSLNTTFVCPATVVEIKGDRIRVEFDGWNQSDWIRYDSREIFPVGWWGKAGININPPPKKRAPTKRRSFASPHSTAKNHNFVNLFDSAKSYLTPETKMNDDKPTNFVKEEDRNVSPAPSSSSDSSRTTTEKKINHHGLPKHTARKSIGLSSFRASTLQTNTDGTDKQTVDVNTNADRTTNLTNKSDSVTPLGSIPPLVIKTSGTVSPSLMAKRKSLSPTIKTSGMDNNSALQQASDIISAEDTSETFTVFLNSSCAAGKWLDASKLQTANTRFGPGTVNNVMKSCVQLLIDCAFDPGYVYHALPPGDGQALVSAVCSGSSRSRRLPAFRSAFDGWKFIATVLDKLQTCPHLLSRQLGDCLSCGLSTPANKKSKIVLTNSDVLPIDISRKRHLSGGSNSSTCTERETGPVLSNEDVQKWNVDEVSRFISSVTDISLGDLFKKQEIDGKALLLLTADMMIKYMNVRLGPAVKIVNALEKMKSPSAALPAEH